MVGYSNVFGEDSIEDADFDLSERMRPAVAVLWNFSKRHGVTVRGIPLRSMELGTE